MDTTDSSFKRYSDLASMRAYVTSPQTSAQLSKLKFKSKIATRMNFYWVEKEYGKSGEFTLVEGELDRNALIDHAARDLKGEPKLESFQAYTFEELWEHIREDWDENGLVVSVQTTGNYNTPWYVIESQNSGIVYESQDSLADAAAELISSMLEAELTA